MTAVQRRLRWVLAPAVLLAACATPPPPAPVPQRMPTVDALVPASPEAVGMHPGLGAQIDSIILAAIADGATPGAAVAVGRYGRLVHLEGYGRLDWAEGSPPVTDSTLYDMASLTKVVATTTAAMILEEWGWLDLDRPVAYHLFGLQSPEKALITVRQLLTHSGGFEAFAALFREFRGREEYLAQINARPLAYPPGEQTIYSDWDFILMQQVIERITRKPLDQFLEERVFGPLGMGDTGYNPLGPPPWLAEAAGDGASAGVEEARPLPDRIAPTEVDTTFRDTHVHGYVHDENAWALGGVAGHAGLFSTARDLAVFAQMLLNGGVYDGVRILHPATIARWTARQSAESSRALGWDTPSGSSSSGRFFSPWSFGHTGFTGTSIWMDPTRGLFVVLLTNRVDPTRENRKHIELRREMANAVQAAVLNAPLIDWESAREPE